MELFAYGVVGILGFAALLVASSIWRGYVLSILWGWFVVPTFGLPALSIPLAIGLALVGGMMSAHSATPKETQGLGPAVIGAIIGPALVLLIGWILTKFL